MSNEQIVPDREIEEQFFESLEDEHITPRDEFMLIMDGEIHRFAARGEHVSNANGRCRYKIYPSGCPCWYIQDWQQHGTMIKKVFDWKRSSLSYEERRDAYAASNTPEAIAEREAKERQRKLKEEAARTRAYKRACEEYDNAAFKLALYHPYVEQKMNPNVGLALSHIIRGLFEWDSDLFPEWPSVSRAFELGVILGDPISGAPCKNGDLLIPLVDAESGIFKTLQRIENTPNANGKYPKGFYSGIPASNSCYRFIPLRGQDAPHIFLVEGFFTGYAVCVLTRMTSMVYCAMSAENLMNVAKSLRKVYPEKKIILMPDNDRGTELRTKSNTGLLKAEMLTRCRLVDAVKIPYIQSRENENIDWYDVLVERYRIEAQKLPKLPRRHYG